ncbi:MAG: class I SAM-dependent DNA methyltransferase [Alphaproteobacteria bacterium]
MSTLEIAESWSRRLGLARSPLLGDARDVHQIHHAMLDGVDGSFSLSGGPIDVGSVLDWTWSSQLAIHVTIEGDAVIARQVATSAPMLRFKREQVDRNPEAFLSSIVAKRIEPPVDVVQHVVDCFRSHRHVGAAAGLNATQALDTFLAVMAEEIAGSRYARHPGQVTADARALFPGDHEDRLREELRYNRLAGRRADLALTMRHAAGMVFQEAHAELLTEPLQRQLFGLASVPGRPSRTQLGAYYTPPGLARTIADLAVADHLNKPVMKIVDPACGSGIFLCEVLRALERRAYRGHVELIGLDVSASAIAMARFALDHGGFTDRPGVVTKVRVCDFLLMEEQLDADVILMNPPFLAMPEMDIQVRTRLQQILGDAFRYRPDLSMAFTSLAQHHLVPGGTLATLLPAGALSQIGGIKWRDTLLRNNEIELVGVLGDHELFRDATVNIASLVLRKTKEPLNVAPTMLWASQKRGASSAALRRLRRWAAGNRHSERTIDWSIYPMPRRLLAGRDDWTPRPYSLGDLPERLADTPGVVAVEDLFHIELGVRAGKNGSALQIDAANYERLPIRERKLFRPVAETRSIRYGRIQPLTWIFYPDEPMTAAEIQAGAPNFYKRHVEHLGLAPEARVDLERARRATNLARRPRLVARAFIATDSFAVDEDGSHVVVQGYSWLPREAVLGAPFETVSLLHDYALLLNSRIFFALLRENGRIVGGGQVDGAKNQVRRVPLPDLAAMYLETPELEAQARVLRELDARERPAAPLLDTFAAAAYRTRVEEWSVS